MSNTTDVHNEYVRVYTNPLAYCDNNEGYSWGFLVVKGENQSYVYKGIPEHRSRIAALQYISFEDLAEFKNLQCLIIPNTDIQSSSFREDTRWTRLVKLNESDYKLLTGTSFNCRQRANNIITYLRRTVTGLDYNKTVYEVPEDTFTEKELKV